MTSSYTIETVDGERLPVLALCLGMHLGAHRLGKRYYVTHLRTGRKVATFDDAERAERFVALADDAAPWADAERSDEQRERCRQVAARIFRQVRRGRAA